MIVENGEVFIPENSSFLGLKYPVAIFWPSEYIMLGRKNICWSNTSRIT
jgi:hypothetical protein